MAFYFALLNVSKKDEPAKTTHRKHHHHRRHSIASIEAVNDFKFAHSRQSSENEPIVFERVEEVHHHHHHHHYDSKIGESKSCGEIQKKRHPSRLPVRTNPRKKKGTSSGTDDSRYSSDDRRNQRIDSPEPSSDASNSIIRNQRLKKVTFENSPYIIAHSFLGDRAVLVRRGSGTPVRRLPICDAATLPTCPSIKVLAPKDDKAYGDDWWTPCCGDDDQHENRVNHLIETIQSRHLIRRRSTTDLSRIIAYRNAGFLTSSQELCQ